MSLKENLKETIKILPESVRQSLKFCISPEIDDHRADNSVLKNFLEVALITGAFITLLKSALPGTIKFDISSAINPFILTIILITNGVTFSFIFYATVRGILALKDRSGFKPAILYQAMKFFTVLNILIPILMMIMANQLAMGLINKSTGKIGMSIGALTTILAIWLLIRTLIKPTAKYLEGKYKKSTAMTLSIFSCFLAFALNPALKLEYFDDLLDKKKLCDFLVEENFKSGILNGTVDFHQELSKCSHKLESANFKAPPRQVNQPEC